MEQFLLNVLAAVVAGVLVALIVRWLFRRPNAKRGPRFLSSTTIFTRKIFRYSNWPNLNQDQPGSLAEPGPEIFKLKAGRDGWIDRKA